MKKGNYIVTFKDLYLCYEQSYDKAYKTLNQIILNSPKVNKRHFKIIEISLSSTKFKELIIITIKELELLIPDKELKEEIKKLKDLLI